MTNRADRDWKLIAAASTALDTTAGCANATITVLKPGRVEKARQYRAVEVVKEIVTRYVELATEVQMASFDYDPNMSEADMRAWAARLMGVVRG